jgi:type II secretory ATPase GspE/PulE/Tfp pilus assembly ATPase PilB-like protein
MTDPTNVFAMDDIKFMTGYNVEPVVASEAMVADAIQKYYNGGKTAPPEAASALEMATKALEDMPAVDSGDVQVLEDLEEISVEALARQGEEAPVIRLVNVMMMSAIHKGASDIHIEPYEKELRIRTHRRRALQRDGAVAEVPRRHRVAREDHGAPRHRREAAAPGRPDQDPLQRQRPLDGD